MLAQTIPFSAESAEALLAALPAAPAVFLLRGVAPSEPYIARTADLRRRLRRLLGPPQPGSKRLNLRSRCRQIEYALSGSDFESRLLLYRLARAEFPRDYRQRLKLGWAPLVRLNLENAFPRAYVTRRVARLRAASRYYGPFPSRASAEKFLNAALDFFKMRRCDFELNPDPAFPGCIYSQMKMCLAPCFQGCTDEEYRGEVARVQAFLESRGATLVREVETARQRASERLEFEAASALHARLEKVRGILGHAVLPELVREVSALHAVVLELSAAPAAVELFRIAGGAIQPPLRFSPQPQSHPAAAAEKKVYSMESRLGELLAELQPAPPGSAAELNDHLALLRRWYYSSRRQGEIFFADARGELPLRRLVRAIGRVLAGEKPEAGTGDEAHRACGLARGGGTEAT